MATKKRRKKNYEVVGQKPEPDYQLSWLDEDVIEQWRDQLTRHWHDVVLVIGPNCAHERKLLGRRDGKDLPLPDRSTAPTYASRHLSKVLDALSERLRILPREYRELELVIKPPTPYVVKAEGQPEIKGVADGLVAVTGYVLNDEQRQKITPAWVSHPFWQVKWGVAERQRADGSPNYPLSDEELHAIRSEAAKRAWRTRKGIDE